MLNIQRLDTLTDSEASRYLRYLLKVEVKKFGRFRGNIIFETTIEMWGREHDLEVELERVDSLAEILRVNVWVLSSQKTSISSGPKIDTIKLLQRKLSGGWKAVLLAKSFRITDKRQKWETPRPKLLKRGKK